jgi:DnaK suppressor protein
VDPATVARLGARLEEERSALREQLVEHGADPDDPGAVGLDLDGGFADTAHTTAERDRLLSLIGELSQTLTDVEDALRRIEAGTYGRCERCGREIGLERLEAIPSARLDIECKQQAAR